MNQELTVIEVEGKLLVDSRDVAEMTKVRHADLLEKIDGYLKYLTNGDFRSLDFFIESTYQDGKGETRRCYLLTRKGCDMVANKMTGEKGVLFTATYVTKFEEMEKKLHKPMSQLEIVQIAINQLVENEHKLKHIENKQILLDNKVDTLSEEFNKYTIRTGDKSAYIVAKELKLYSKNNKPHFNFVDAIAKKIGFYSGNLGDKNEFINVIMDNTHNGNSGIAVYYTDKAVDLMKEFLHSNFNLEVIYFKRDSGIRKKGEPKDFKFNLGSKDWSFHKDTYEYYQNSKEQLKIAQ